MDFHFTDINIYKTDIKSHFGWLVENEMKVDLSLIP